MDSAKWSCKLSPTAMDTADAAGPAEATPPPSPRPLAPRDELDNEPTLTAPGPVRVLRLAHDCRTLREYLEPYTVGERYLNGHRVFPSVLKEYDALFVEPEDRVFWETGALDVARRHDFTAPEAEGVSWRMLANLLRTFVPDRHPLFLRVAAIINEPSEAGTPGAGQQQRPFFKAKRKSGPACDTVATASARTLAAPSESTTAEGAPLIVPVFLYRGHGLLDTYPGLTHACLDLARARQTTARTHTLVREALLPDGHLVEAVVARVLLDYIAVAPDLVYCSSAVLADTGGFAVNVDPGPDSPTRGARRRSTDPSVAVDSAPSRVSSDEEKTLVWGHSYDGRLMVDTGSRLPVMWRGKSIDLPQGDDRDTVMATPSGELMVVMRSRSAGSSPCTVCVMSGERLHPWYLCRIAPLPFMRSILRFILDPIYSRLLIVNTFAVIAAVWLPPSLFIPCAAATATAVAAAPTATATPSCAPAASSSSSPPRPDAAATAPDRAGPSTCTMIDSVITDAGGKVDLTRRVATDSKEVLWEFPPDVFVVQCMFTVNLYPPRPGDVSFRMRVTLRDGRVQTSDSTDLFTRLANSSGIRSLSVKAEGSDPICVPHLRILAMRPNAT